MAAASRTGQPDPRVALGSAGRRRAEPVAGRRVSDDVRARAGGAVRASGLQTRRWRCRRCRCTRRTPCRRGPHRGARGARCGPMRWRACRRMPAIASVTSGVDVRGGVTVDGAGHRRRPVVRAGSVGGGSRCAGADSSRRAGVSDGVEADRHGQPLVRRARDGRAVRRPARARHAVGVRQVTGPARPRITARLRSATRLAPVARVERRRHARRQDDAGADRDRDDRDRRRPAGRARPGCATPPSSARSARRSRSLQASRRGPTREHQFAASTSPATGSTPACPARSRARSSAGTGRQEVLRRSDTEGSIQPWNLARRTIEPANAHLSKPSNPRTCRTF